MLDFYIVLTIKFPLPLGMIAQILHYNSVFYRATSLPFITDPPCISQAWTNALKLTIC